MTPQNHQKFNLETIAHYRTILRFVLTWAATIAILWIVFSRTNPPEVLVLLKQTNIRYLGLGILLSLLAHVFFSLARYQNIIKLVGCRLSFGEAVMLRMGCNAVKGVLPFKTGELAIVAYMKKMHNLSYPAGLFSVLFGNVFSLIVLLLFFSAGGIFYFSGRPQSIIFGVACLLLFLLLILLSSRRIGPSVSGYVQKYFRLPEVLMSIMENYDPGTIKYIIIHSLGIEGSKLLIIFTLLQSLHVEIPYAVLLLWGSATILAAYLPLTYWGLGVREATVLFLFSRYAPPDKLLAGGLLITFVDSILPVLIGLFFVKPFLDNLLGSKKAETDIISGSG
ncbi:MAG: lysylphosphatidylglycerol synthase transmembrane domain-containing protein [Smithella sp.]